MARKKAAKKKSPTPLTADMLNELNKNHMGGLENYGAEDVYNMEDTWDERRQDVKPKVKVRFLSKFFTSKILNFLIISASQTPSLGATQTFTTAGDHSICSVIKLMNIITTLTIRSTNFNQSILNNISNHHHSKIFTADQSASWSRSGKKVLILHIMETVVTIIVLEG